MKNIRAIAILVALQFVTTAAFSFRDGLFGSTGRREQIKRRLMLASTRNDAVDHEKNSVHESSSSLKVGVAGAGAVAFGMASILSKSGHHSLLWSPSGKGTIELMDEEDSDSDGRERQSITSTGALDHEFSPKIVSSAQQLAMESDVLIIALPANGHKQVFDALAPHLSTSSPSSSAAPKKHIIISSHASFGALYLSQFLHELGNHHHTITSWGTTVCTARRTSGRTVDIKTIRKSVDTSCVPESHLASSLELCNRLFPGINFRPREGLLAITLSNLNPQNHLAIALGNISRMDKGEEWYQFQNITPRIGGFLEALDKERLAIASALGLDVKTVYEHFNLSFHVPIPESGSLSEMCQGIYEKGNDVYGPIVADSRYITEDVPFGLAPVVALGKLVGRPAVLHESGMAICNAMYGRDFSAENDLLEAIGLDQIELGELQEAARTGQLSKPLFEPATQHG